MSSSVLFCFSVEVVLVFLTTFLLSQPQSVFKGASKPIQNFAFGSGVILIGLTFCWSVLLGIVSSLNQLAIHY
jgi:hypothetical protein